jgi:hypothetical protein
MAFLSRSYYGGLSDVDQLMKRPGQHTGWTLVTLTDQGSGERNIICSPAAAVVDVDSLGVADAEVGVGLGQEPRMHAVEPTGLQGLLDELADEFDVLVSGVLVSPFIAFPNSIPEPPFLTRGAKMSSVFMFLIISPWPC